MGGLGRDFLSCDYVYVCIYRPKPTKEHKDKGILRIFGIYKLSIAVRLSNRIGSCHGYLQKYEMMIETTYDKY